MKRRTLLSQLTLLPVVVVAGCDAGADRAELEAWMAQQRRDVRPAPLATPAVAMASSQAAPGLATLPDPFRPDTKPTGPARTR